MPKPNILRINTAEINIRYSGINFFPELPEISYQAMLCKPVVKPHNTRQTSAKEMQIGCKVNT